MSSLNFSVDGGFRWLKIGVFDLFVFECCRWLDFELELNDFVLNFGCLKMDIIYELDFDEFDLE